MISDPLHEIDGSCLWFEVKSRDLVLKVLKLFADYDNSSDHPVTSPVIPPSVEQDIGVDETHVFQVFIYFLFTVL
jgi:hypothetical protein